MFIYPARSWSLRGGGIPDTPILSQDCITAFNAYDVGYTAGGQPNVQYSALGEKISTNNTVEVWAENGDLIACRFDQCNNLQNAVNITNGYLGVSWAGYYRWSKDIDISADGDYVVVVAQAYKGSFDFHLMAVVLNVADLSIAAGPTELVTAERFILEVAVRCISGADNYFLVNYYDDPTNRTVNELFLHSGTSIISVGPQRAWYVGDASQMKMCQTDDSRSGQIAVFHHETSGQEVRMHISTATGQSVNSTVLVSDGPGDANMGNICEYYEYSSDWWGYLTVYQEVVNGGTNQHDLYVKAWNRSGGTSGKSRLKLADYSGHDWTNWIGVCRMYDDYHYLIVATDDNYNATGKTRLYGWIINYDLEIVTGPWVVWDPNNDIGVNYMEVHQTGDGESYTIIFNDITTSPADKIRNIVLSETT